MKISRRNFLRNVSIGLASIPMMVCNRQAMAQTNAALRTKFRYQDTPKDHMSCTFCLEFILGKSEIDRGGCKLMPGDDEISPSGYCTEWNSM